jgi:hypothetical protein
VYTTVEKHQARSMAFSTPGRLNEKYNPASLRPFILSLVSNFLFSSRNAFQIRLPRVTSSIKIRVELFGCVPSDAISNITKILELPIFMGENRGFILKLCLKTQKEDAPIKFLPVDRVLNVGFSGPAKPKDKQNLNSSNFSNQFF